MDEPISEVVYKVAEEVLAGLIPSKLKDRYETENDALQSLMHKKKVNMVNETVLLAYFGEMTKKYQCSSLWAKYSMIKRMLSVKKNIDISTYYKLSTFLKNNSVGHEPKKGMVLSKENIIKFVQEASNETSND